MSKDFTNSSMHRQNILNNPYALQEIEKATHITGIPFEGKADCGKTPLLKRTHHLYKKSALSVSDAHYGHERR